MKTYQCTHCGNLLYFENTRCLQCDHAVGFNPAQLSFVALVKKDNHYADADNAEASYRYCANHQHGVCNWLVPNDNDGDFCLACSFNGTIPSLDNPDNIEKWKKLEVAKHRLIYSLLRLNLPLANKMAGEDGLQFDFLTPAPDSKIMTGHNNGVITINADEADEAERTNVKVSLREKYRTLLGHFRHEIGHYYWDVLIRGSNLADDFRNLFGDETIDYTAALQRHYEEGAPADWADNFISPYAAAHPWEDWAESWSHYLHMMDTLETAHTFGIGIHPVQKAHKKVVDAEIKKDPYQCKSFDEIIGMWLPLTFAVNSLNRSMGHPDFYPFVISPPVIEKLKFIHNICGARDGMKLKKKKSAAL